MEYHDKNGAVLRDGDLIRWPDGQIDELVLTADGELGTDATSRAWINSGRAVPFEYGVFPLTAADMAEIVKVDSAQYPI